MTGYQSKKDMAQDKLAQPEQEPVREALKLALEALLNSVDLVVEDAYNAEQLYGSYPTRQARIGGLKGLADKHREAIAAAEEALAQPAQEPINVRAKFLAENIVESIDCGDAAGAKATLEMLTALAQPEQELIVGTKTWFEDGKVVTQHLTAKDIYKEPEQEPAIPSTRDAANKVGPFWQEFSALYEAIGRQQITIREIAWRCFLAAKITTQPAQEPWPEEPFGHMAGGVQPEQKPAFWLNEQGQLWSTQGDSERNSIGQKIIPLYTAPPQRKPLTDEEMDNCLRRAGVIATLEALRCIGREVEAAHGIKE